MLHWITQSAPSSLSDPQAFTLRAALEGSFTSVAQAKTDTRAAQIVHAPPVHVTDRTTSAPESRIPIPRNAAPGLYNVTSTVTGSQSTISSGSIIRIARP